MISEELIKIFSIKIRNVLLMLDIEMAYLQEIRLRPDRPLNILYKNEKLFIDNYGRMCRESNNVFIVEKKEIKETMEYIGNYSLYAYEEEIKQGFITIKGGHRVGIVGKTVLDDGKIKNIKYISFINIRIAHEIKGAADRIMNYIVENEVSHTLIISPPGCGKTTLIRDIIRQISYKKYNVSVVDERSEIGASYMGIPANDLGPCTDVLDCCPKDMGMLMMIRSMSPEVLAIDEIGSTKDVDAIEYIVGSGCKVIATVHGNSYEDIKVKPYLNKLIKNHTFEKYIVLNKKTRICNIEGIYNKRGERIC